MEPSLIEVTIRATPETIRRLLADTSIDRMVFTPPIPAWVSQALAAQTDR